MARTIPTTRAARRAAHQLYPVDRATWLVGLTNGPVRYNPTDNIEFLESLPPTPHVYHAIPAVDVVFPEPTRLRPTYRALCDIQVPLRLTRGPNVGELIPVPWAERIPANRMPWMPHGSGWRPCKRCLHRTEGRAA